MNKQSQKIPELLAPAGSLEAAYAAIYSGCDAIYLGGKSFNARANATNFELDNMKRAADLCRLFDVKLYITMNTLLYDREFKRALEYVESISEAVVPDAIIVQDIGFAAELHRHFPTIPLHASTQMRLHNTDAADMLRRIGITRIILARELSLDDIKSATSSGVETEIFVHGALCVSQSGGCLMSSMIGKRSGNRGECAQPCRLPYKSENRYPLSLKDLCLASHIPALIESGVTSLKIEGRMKSPDYVAGVVSIYRKLLDERRAATKEELSQLDKLFSRQGFTDSYLFAKPGLKMFGYRTETQKAISRTVSENKNYTALLEKRISAKAAEIVQPYPKAAVEPLNVEYIKPKDYTVLRFLGSFPKTFKKPEYLGFIDIPLWRISEMPEFYKKLAPVRAIMPNVCTESDKRAVKTMLEQAKKAGISDIVITNLSQIPLCESLGFNLHGDIALNAVNEHTLSFYEKHLKTIALSPELGAGALKAMKKPLLCELIVYGKLPLMHTENCIIESKSGRVCDRNKKFCRSVLTDRTGANFPVFREFNHRNTIFNSVPIYLLDKAKELKQCGISGKILLFTDENAVAIDSIIDKLTSPAKPDFSFTRSYF